MLGHTRMHFVHATQEMQPEHPWCHQLQAQEFLSHPFVAVCLPQTPVSFHRLVFPVPR